MVVSEPGRVWTVAEAKAKLSEILRLAETEGPQRIGARKPFIVVPERVWREHAPPPRKPLGQWLIENMPRGTNLEIPDRGGDSRREIPFADWTMTTGATSERIPPGHKRCIRDDQEQPQSASHRLSGSTC